MPGADPDFVIERLSAEDVSLNVALAHRVGWKDVETEWRVLHEAGDVRGIRHAPGLAAQGVLGDYGSAAMLAKMVVAPELQRRGLGARLLDAFLAEADERRLPVGLCATDAGRPLYESRGFAVVGELMILVGAPASGTASPASVVPLADVEQAIELDREVSGCDRGRMLRARFREAKSRVRLEAARGFGLRDARPDHDVVGPILAETEAGARALALALFSAAPGPVRIDVPLEQAEFRRWLVGLGLREHSPRVEMARGIERLPWQSPRRFALATQAWG